jgi:hypothetical protein
MALSSQKITSFPTWPCSQCCRSGGSLGGGAPFFKLWGGAEPPFYFRKSRIYYVTEEIQSSGDTKYRMYSCPRTKRENVTLVHLRRRISVTISTKIFSFDLKISSRISQTFEL